MSKMDNKAIIKVKDVVAGTTEVHEAMTVPNSKHPIARQLYAGLFNHIVDQDLGEILDECQSVMNFFEWALENQARRKVAV